MAMARLEGRAGREARGVWPCAWAAILERVATKKALTVARAVAQWVALTVRG